MSLNPKLDAVNQCLGAIGETAVSSLASGVPDAEAAERVVDEITEDVLSAGWHFNTDTKVKLVRNVNGQIPVPGSVFRVDTTDVDRDRRVAVRVDPTDGVRKLFDLDAQTFSFPKDLWVTQVHLFDYNDIPFGLRRYIAARAAAIFQQRQMGSATLDKFLEREMNKAWALCVDEESEQDDRNILTDSPHCVRITGRFNAFYGR